MVIKVQVSDQAIKALPFPLLLLNKCTVEPRAHASIPFGKFLEVNPVLQGHNVALCDSLANVLKFQAGRCGQHSNDDFNC